MCNVNISSCERDSMLTFSVSRVHRLPIVCRKQKEKLETRSFNFLISNRNLSWKEQKSARNRKNNQNQNQARRNLNLK